LRVSCSAHGVGIGLGVHPASLQDHDPYGNRDPMPLGSFITVHPGLKRQQKRFAGSLTAINIDEPFGFVLCFTHGVTINPDPQRPLFELYPRAERTVLIGAFDVSMAETP
jgi:hypothetical protein